MLSTPRTTRSLPLALVAASLLSGCSAAGETGTPAAGAPSGTGSPASDGPTTPAPAEVAQSESASVPPAWLERTAAAWPESSAYGGTAPVLSAGDCLLTDEVQVLGGTASTDLSGFGPYGDDPSAEDAYRHVCELRGEDLSIQLQLIRVASPDDAQQTVDLFLDQASDGDQENDPTTVQVDGVDVHVNHRWYPGPEYGEATALLHDPAAGALVAMEVTSLEEGELDAYEPEQVAADLLGALSSD